MSPTPIYHRSRAAALGLMTALVAGALIALVAANIYLYVQIDHCAPTWPKMQEKLMTEISNLRTPHR